MSWYSFNCSLFSSFDLILSFNKKRVLISLKWSWFSRFLLNSMFSSFSTRCLVLSQLDFQFFLNSILIFFYPILSLFFNNLQKGKKHSWHWDENDKTIHWQTKIMIHTKKWLKIDKLQAKFIWVTLGVKKRVDSIIRWFSL